jgi:histidinol-phosphate aminotransferase
MRLPIRPNVLQMHPYVPGKPISEVQRELGLDRVVKLASNENPLGPSPMAMEAVRKVASEMHLYPDGAAYELRHAIAGNFEVGPEQVILGNGSDELIALLGEVFLSSPEDELLTGDPSFVRYDAAAQIAPATLVRVPLDPDCRFDLEALGERLSPRTRLVFIANPNNPTGTIVRRAELERFIDQLPEGCVLVLDEAYFEFAAADPEYPNSLDYLRKGLPVVGLRTFSKAYGLAGLRVGFGFAPAEIADAIERARSPFNVNALAQAAGVAALGDEEHLRRTLANNAQELPKLVGLLENAGAKVPASHANFAYADFGFQTRPVFDALLRRGVVVRLMPDPECLRISVGSAEEMEFFSVQFAAVMEALPQMANA